MKKIRLILLSLILLSITFIFSIRVAHASEGCEQWVAKAVRVQGKVVAQISGQTEAAPVRLNDTFCPGDMIQVGERSRASFFLRNETTTDLDQNTTLIFTRPEKEEVSIIELLKGAVHFISRTPRTLEVITPFVNAGVEGTEFLVRVDDNQTVVTVFEGQVKATNDEGSLSIDSGGSAIAEAGKAPATHIMVRPRDAVQWALYYPIILDYRISDFPDSDEGWQAAIRKSIGYYRDGDLTKAFSSLDDIRDKVPDPRFYTYRASLLLTVGRVDDAREDIKTALSIQPDNSHALSLQSIIAIVLNEGEKALSLAEKAVEADPESAAAKIALSFAQQARFDLEGALESTREAVKLDPENSLARARLAEMWLSFKELDRALEAAKKAVELNPDLSRTQSVLGYAYLVQIKIDESLKAFEKAIALDQASPLPRLGLGLAKIRKGDLEEGRREIEIATSLDPDRSLIRSYMGKAYYEEKRDDLAESQYDIAKELDPQDPTPFFYDAIRKQTINRPVEALQDMQKSIELNNNRAVFRSKFLLDDDLAARSASIARIYNDLGFQQLGLVEGWKSVNTAPGNFSGHRFLADTYAALPRHEIARVSELLQSQLLQPINITPIQPSLGESNVLVLEGAGPSDLSFNEFNPLFNRNRLALQLNGIVGGNDTFGSEIVFSGVQDRFSFSAGQFHYETDGFRDNNDVQQDIFNVFGQLDLTYKTSFLVEFRHKDFEEGDLPLRFDKDGENNFDPNLRKKGDTNTLRFGLRHSLSPHSNIIGHFTVLDGEEEGHDITPFSTVDISVKDEGYMTEGQYLFSSDLVHITSGIGYFSADREESILILLVQPPLPPTPLEDSLTETDISHTNLYVYANVDYPANFTLTLGGSVDFFDDNTVDESQFNPKLGLIWTPVPATTLRAALFRTLKRTLVSNQTIEPTQVAGFNQFFDDPNGTDAWRYGVAIDQKFSDLIFGGIEYSRREMERPFTDLTRGGLIDTADWDDEVIRAYLYWTPKLWLALSAEYLFEQFERDDKETGDEQIRKVDTHRLPLEVRFFHPSGLSAQFKATYVDQDGEFGKESNGFFTGDDRFWVADASIGYRLPKRYGLISFGVKNLFDEEFQFQDTDLAKQEIYPERFFFGKLTLSF